MAREAEHDRLLSRVAVMYHRHGLRQAEIARKLEISQPQVSRLLEEAQTRGIVQVSINIPDGLQFDLEEQLENTYTLKDAHVVDVSADDEQVIVQELGQVLSHYLPTYIKDAKVIGFTSWSRSLRETISSLSAAEKLSNVHVVEMLGDVGPPHVQHEAASQTQALAHLLGGETHYLRVPGVTQSKRIRNSYLDRDQYARDALELLNSVDVALSGIGTCEVVAPLIAGDNFFTDEQFEIARRKGAVGQVNLRFIDAQGLPVATGLDELVIGVTLDQLRNAKRKVSVAGGVSKFEAIRAALRGGWVDTIVTDTYTAQRLIDNP
jgi:DNA-binding transcriptional regulator LsrR (DeoR family)